MLSEVPLRKSIVEQSRLGGCSQLDLQETVELFLLLEMTLGYWKILPVPSCDSSNKVTTNAFSQK
jgi:hypothetical protein